ncbi:unnamed protein product [Polarella glacialis]|uniref:Uncharacterized protein n=1 Tax=Polarella glacialis TaxID=89957 RepID=A0A813GQR1_POLGL|nr:unnamed protein product [Polarella glacialis]CAE8628707.1 unnamed protein product [Polarella glacialis]CAE8718607.1 unnamed protein product [Polarella glacialis]
MESLMNSLAPNGSGHDGKRRRTQPVPFDEKLRRLATFSGKLGLHLAARSRVHDSCCLHVATLPANHSVSMAMFSAGKSYFEKRKTSTARNLGSPHLFVWAAAILAVKNLPDLPESDRQTLNAHALAYDVIGNLAQLVHICSISKAWAKDTAKVEFSVAPELDTVLDVVLRALTNSGADLKAGPPPRSRYERAVAQLLLDLGESPEPPVPD